MTRVGSADGGTLVNQTKGGGSIPTPTLFFRLGERKEAEDLVLRFHYSRRVPSNVQMVATAHVAGGLFGTDGECVAALFLSIPPTRWSEPVIELSRLVRHECHKIQVSRLVSWSMKQARVSGMDLVVSFADSTQGHHGGIYQACGWKYDGQRESRMDGVTIDGVYYAGRSCNSSFGTRSPSRLSSMFPRKKIEPHYDTGKHLYWFALSGVGIEKASRLKLRESSYPKPDKEPVR